MQYQLAFAEASHKTCLDHFSVTRDKVTSLAHMKEAGAHYKVAVNIDQNILTRPIRIQNPDMFQTCMEFKGRGRSYKTGCARSISREKIVLCGLGIVKKELWNILKAKLFSALSHLNRV